MFLFKLKTIIVIFNSFCSYLFLYRNLGVYCLESGSPKCLDSFKGLPGENEDMKL